MGAVFIQSDLKQSPLSVVFMIHDAVYYMFLRRCAVCFVHIVVLLNVLVCSH